MPKNILQFDVVHQIKNIMQVWDKRTLPKASTASLCGVSALLNDGPASTFKTSQPEIQPMNIKLFLYYQDVF